jgi:hypothetical protein
MVTNPYYFFKGGSPTGGGSGGCIMENDNAVPTDHGGLESGTTIKGLSPCDVLNMILYPYQYPAFTSFYIDGQATILEIGDKISGGTRTFKWVTKNNENIVDNTLKITDVNTNTILGENLANDGSEDLDIGDDKVKTAPNSSYVWKIEGTNTKNEIFSRNFTVYWRAKVFWGNSVNDTITEDEVKNNFNSQLKSNFPGTYNYTNSGQEEYYYIVYPDTFGDLSEWKDTETGFGVDYTQLDNINITNDFNVTLSYKVYRTTYKQTSDLNSSIS